MGLFGFGKKKRQSEEAAEAAAEENDKADEAKPLRRPPVEFRKPSFRNRPMSTTAVAMSTVRGTSTTRTCPTMTNTSTWAPTICRSSKASNCA